MNRDRSESGAILVLTAALLLVLIGFAALAVDLGNAWSSDRFTQTSADLAALSALQEVPYTFRGGTPSALSGQPAAEDTTNAEVAALTGINLPDASIDSVTLSPDYFDVSVQLSLPVDTGFARAIGVSTVTVNASSTARTRIVDRGLLYPLGISSNDSYECLRIDPLLPAGFSARCAAAPTGLDLMDMAVRNTLDCDTDNVGGAPARAIANLLNGVDHLVDLADTPTVGADLRTEKAACFDGHQLTMPSATREVSLPAGSTVLDTALANGRLATDAVPLWDHLLGTAPLNCAPANFAAFVFPDDFDAAAAAMQLCLETWLPAHGVIFDSLAGPRFGWIIEHDDVGSNRKFVDFHPAYLNTMVTSDLTVLPEQAQFLSGATDPSPGAAVGALTVFILDERMVIASDIENTPYGAEHFEFSLNN